MKNKINMFKTQEQEEYERDLAKRQSEHLRNVFVKNNSNWCPCMHDQCTSCHGTGIKIDGGPCIHAISCPCPKCTTSC